MSGTLWARGALALATSAALMGGVAPSASGAGADPSGPGAVFRAGNGPDRAVEVTLVTGDVVHWNTSGDRSFATVEDNGDDSTFQVTEDADGYYVIPSEVSALVGTYLDKELFNVSGLVAQGYTDDRTGGTPVILQTSAKDRRTRTAPPGLTLQRSLPSISAVSGVIKERDTGAFGKALASVAKDRSKLPAAQQNRSFTAAALPGVRKIWLDRKVHASLEDSVPQTGAPQAWDAGYDGTGSTVAVLDTGIDAEHPDLVDQVTASRNFTPEDSVADGHGHGTHVASTVAGTGAASDGLRKGVAPGADLVIGKVLDSAGEGSESDILAGMEWAAGLPEVDAINMSLGAVPSDGTDPMSLAVNNLTEQTGKLFVIAAGNDGPRAGTVSYPGTADAALTVGAVDGQHDLAWFSSRGPRVGNYGIKPEITAPGVGIRAARAQGTSMGDPVDDNYTAADGTSMAAPHVAGAVAILKQEHPDWGPEMLKSALVNSANPREGVTVFQQGAGELDVAGAYRATVVSTPSTLSLGNHEFPHDGAEPITRTLTFTNTGEAATTVDLAVENLADDKGNPAPEGMVTATPASLELAPGASSEVEVTLDRSLGDLGLFTGNIVASGPDGERISGTPVAFNKEQELLELTVNGIQRNGNPADDSSGVNLLDADDFTVFGRASLEYVDGVSTIRVPPGNYSVMTHIGTEDAEGTTQGLTIMGKPEIEINEDTELTFDAGQAQPITVDTPYRDTEMHGQAFQFNRTDAAGHSFTSSFVGGNVPLYAAPTEPVTRGSFHFASRFELSAPGVWMDLNHPESGQIPTSLAYQVNDRTTATVDSRYHSDVDGASFERAHVATNPWEKTGFAMYRYFDGPVRRVEHVSGGDTTWFQAVDLGALDGAAMYEPVTTHENGAHLEQSWYGAPRGPGIDEGSAEAPTELPNTRTGDEMDVNIFEWGDANSGQLHYQSLNWGTDTAAFNMYVDGELYAQGERAFGTVPVPAGKSRMRFELDVAREGQPWWTTSTKTHTAWEFDSDTTAETVSLPLLQLDYDIDLDLKNTTRAPRDVKGPFAIGIDARTPYSAARTELEGVKVWLSYDDGKTWIAQKVKANKPGRGDSPFEVRPKRRNGGGFASLRVEASDDAGNTVTQEVIRAYRLRR